MKKTWVLLALLMMVSWPCSAQLTRLPSTVAKSFLKVPGQIKIPAEAFASSAAYQAHLRALERENFRDLDRMMKVFFVRFQECSARNIAAGRKNAAYVGAKLAGPRLLRNPIYAKPA